MVVGNILFIDASLSGLSGDMFISAFLDMGFPFKLLKDVEGVLKKYYPSLKQIKITPKKVERGGLLYQTLTISFKRELESISAIKLHEILENSLNELKINGKYFDYAISVLDTLIKAESAIHKKLDSELHLHELSSPDTLFDILSVTLALRYYSILDGVRIYSTPLPVGGGVINFSHGKINVPAPAVAHMLKEYQIPFSFGPVEDELVTPTGLAIFVNLNPKFTPIPYTIVLEKIGYGCGNKEFNDFPNVLRISLNKIYSNYHSKYLMDHVIVLETNLDDIDGETLGFTVDKLIDLGALDVSVIPLLGKKGRPAYLLKVLCEIDNEDKLLNEIFSLTNTLGIRFSVIGRYKLERKIEKFVVKIKDKEFKVRIKLFSLPDGTVDYKPEFDDIIRIHHTTGFSINEIKKILSKKLNHLNLKF
ncbi:MAG: nickel pincer cofactor biosynthesis protein LarC [Candidatus Odinarchaeia archaeon]